MKTYATKSNARRAAKQAGLTEEQFTIVEVDGKFGFEEAVKREVVTPRQQEENAIRALQEQVKNALSDLEIALARDAIEATENLAEAVRLGLISILDGKRAKKKDKEEAMVGVPHTKASSVILPVKTVWHIADEMFRKAEEAGEPQPRRKDVISECVQRGVAFYTARTQYQQWWLCRNGKY